MTWTQIISTILISGGTSLLYNRLYDAYYQRKAVEEVGEYEVQLSHNVYNHYEVVNDDASAP